MLEGENKEEKEKLQECHHKSAVTFTFYFEGVPPEFAKAFMLFMDGRTQIPLQEMMAMSQASGHNPNISRTSVFLDKEIPLTPELKVEILEREARRNLFFRECGAL